MGCNKHRPHLVILPEDDANRDIANGFELNPFLDSRSLQVVPVKGGGGRVFNEFISDYIPKMDKHPEMHVLLLLDSDGRPDKYLRWTDQIPDRPFLFPGV